MNIGDKVEWNCQQHGFSEGEVMHNFEGTPARSLIAQSAIGDTYPAVIVATTLLNPAGTAAQKAQEEAEKAAEASKHKPLGS